VGDTGFDEVAHAVGFVVPLFAREAVLDAGLERVVGVDVAVRMLGGGDGGDEGVEIAVESGAAGGILLCCNQVGPALDHLVDVGVIEEEALVGAGVGCAGDLGGGALEVGDASCDVALVAIGGEGAGADGVEARAPE
jgi:hypothetical protein